MIYLEPFVFVYFYQQSQTWKSTSLEERFGNLCTSQYNMILQITVLYCKNKYCYKKGLLCGFLYVGIVYCKTQREECLIKLLCTCKERQHILHVHWKVYIIDGVVLQYTYYLVFAANHESDWPFLWLRQDDEEQLIWSIGPSLIDCQLIQNTFSSLPLRLLYLC